MSARDDYPEPVRLGSRAGSEEAFQKTSAGWRAQREQMCDEIDRLRATVASLSVPAMRWAYRGDDE